MREHFFAGGDGAFAVASGQRKQTILHLFYSIDPDTGGRLFTLLNRLKLLYIRITKQAGWKIHTLLPSMPVVVRE